MLDFENNQDLKVCRRCEFFLSIKKDDVLKDFYPLLSIMALKCDQPWKGNIDQHPLEGHNYYKRLTMNSVIRICTVRRGKVEILHLSYAKWN